MVLIGFPWKLAPLSPPKVLIVHAESSTPVAGMLSVLMGRSRAAYMTPAQPRVGAGISPRVNSEQTLSPSVWRLFSSACCFCIGGAMIGPLEPHNALRNSAAVHAGTLAGQYGLQAERKGKPRSSTGRENQVGALFIRQL